MELLKERIRKDGVMKPGNVLKVDSFLNHQMDVKLFNEMGKEFKRRFEGVRIDKILTIEASGIGIAAIVAQYFDCPVVFAKKSQSINLDGTMLSSQIESFTHKRKYEVIVASRFIRPDENILIIDDFMANGCAAAGLCEIVEAAHANVAGIGIVIEKGTAALCFVIVDTVWNLLPLWKRWIRKTRRFVSGMMINPLKK